MHFYHPQTKLRKGNVFTSVCQEFCLRGKGGAPPPWADTPPHIRRPLQWTVRILLECILVIFQNFGHIYKFIK